MYKLKGLFIALVISILSGSVSASGGLYSKQDEDGLSVNSVTLTYRVDHQNGITTLDFVQDYTGDDDQFLWIIPVPDDPKLEIEANVSPFELPDTPIIFDPPPNYCVDMAASFSGGDGGDDPNRGYPQFEDIHLLKQDDLLNWLQFADYLISEKQLETIETYAQKGMNFAVFDMSQESYATHGSLLLRLKYHSDQIYLPFEVLQATAGGFEIHINILADSRYVSTNYTDVKLDVSRLRMEHSPNRDRAGLPYFTDRSNYLELSREALKAVDYQGFITELAAPIDLLRTEMKDQTSEKGIYFRMRISHPETLDAYHYLTRFYGVAKLGLPIAEFVPSSTAPDVSNIVDATSTEPLLLWGCTTRSIPNENYEKVVSNLPSDYVLIDSGEPLPAKELAAPLGWQLSKITYHSQLLSILAPEPVDEKTLSTYFEGGTTPPMLVVYSTEDTRCGNLYDVFNLSNSANAPRYSRCITNFSPAAYMDLYTAFLLLTSQEDFAAHEAMYKAMVNFPFTNQYMLHPELRNTLLLNPSYGSNSDLNSYMPPLELAYPEGWQERMISRQELLIMPEESRDMNSAPYVHFYMAEKVAAPSIMSLKAKFAENKNNVVDWLVTQFGVDKQAVIGEYLKSCGLSTPLTYFSKNGRTGYVSYVIGQYVYDQPFVLEISAPDALYSQYQHDIENMRDSVVTLFGCG